MADNQRSIPSLLDGLKPAQRKVLFSCFKRNLKKEIKVAQLAGYVSEHSAYHHGEASLNRCVRGRLGRQAGRQAGIRTDAPSHPDDALLHIYSTIVGMAQNFVGSNNVSFLYPSGQFGTRIMGGKDAASPRYVFTRLEEITRQLFHPEDDQVRSFAQSCKRGKTVKRPAVRTCFWGSFHALSVSAQLLAYQDEDGQTIEPEFYVPIIPTVLVNGSDGG